MKKRTEVLMISLILTGTAIVAALTSNDGFEPTETGTATESTVVAEAPAAPAEAAKTIKTAETAGTDTTPVESERRGNPVVYDMDIPAEVLSDY